MKNKDCLNYQELNYIYDMLPECQVVWDLSSLPPLYQTLHTGSSQLWIVKFMMIWYFKMYCKIFEYIQFDIAIYCKGPAVAQPDEAIEKGQFFLSTF